MLSVKKFLISVFKLLAYCVLRLFVSVQLYVFALLFVLAFYGAVFCIVQIMTSAFPDIYLLKYTLLSALPLWLIFEVIVHIRLRRKLRRLKTLTEKQ